MDALEAYDDREEREPQPADGMVGRAVPLDALEQEMYDRHTGPYKLSADQPGDPRTLALSVGVQSFPFSHGGGEPEEMDWYRRMVAKGLAHIVRGVIVRDVTELVGFVSHRELRLLRAGAPSTIHPTNIGDPSRIGLHRYVARSGDAVDPPPISAETPGEYARGWRDGQAVERAGAGASVPEPTPAGFFPEPFTDEDKAAARAAYAIAHALVAEFLWKPHTTATADDDQMVLEHRVEKFMVEQFRRSGMGRLEQRIEERLRKLEAAAHPSVAIPIGNIMARLEALEARNAFVPTTDEERHAIAADPKTELKF